MLPAHMKTQMKGWCKTLPAFTCALLLTVTGSYLLSTAVSSQLLPNVPGKTVFDGQLWRLLTAPLACSHLWLLGLQLLWALLVFVPLERSLGS